MVRNRINTYLIISIVVVVDLGSLMTISKQNARIDVLTELVVKDERLLGASGPSGVLPGCVKLKYSSPIVEWLRILLFHVPRNRPTKIITPIMGISRDSIEDTFGAFRSESRKHEGIDVFARTGTPVLNAIEGEVLFVGRDGLGGNVVKIVGDDKRIYYYAHLERATPLEEGKLIQQGKIIGYVGRSGDAVATPPHLHFEVMEIKWLFPPVYVNIDPWYLLPQKNG